MKRIILILAIICGTTSQVHAANPLRELSKGLVTKENESVQKVTQVNLDYLSLCTNEKLRKAERKLEACKKKMESSMGEEEMKECQDKIKSAEEKIRLIKELQTSLDQAKN